MLKCSYFRGESEHGPSAIPLFGKADAFFEKTASVQLLPDVVKYIAELRPQRDSQYVLVNAMGASEWWSSNVNGDAFPEASLIHKPDDWTGNPIIDRIRAKTWPYGFPTFYRSHVFAHHRNKDAGRAFGDVELAAWNPDMKRVELVTRVDKDKCLKFGGQGTWDKLRSGAFPDLSMGCKVPFDTCSCCLDWDLYKKAQETFDQKKHKHPGLAILEYHKTIKKIRGLSITRSDYCSHALKEMNKIYPDGRKVCVYNDWPSFFDISFVFIGADKTAKTMLFIFAAGVSHAVKPSAEVADDLGLTEPDEGSKTASIHDAILKQAFGFKVAKTKDAEIEKDVVPSQFAGKAVPVLTRSEEDLPSSVMDRLSAIPPENVLSTLGGMGILLRPREFQRITLIQLGKSDVADDLESRGEVFSKSKDRESMGVEAKNFLPALADMLASFMAARSFLAPEIERRIVMSPSDRKTKTAHVPSHSKDLLDKIAAAYNGYRQDVMELAAHSQHLLSAVGSTGSLRKLASISIDEVFTPLSVAYLQYAYEDEYGIGVGCNREQTYGRRGGGTAPEEHVKHH